MAPERLMPKEESVASDDKGNLHAPRVGEHIDAGQPRSFLVSDSADYMNGSSIVTDGGNTSAMLDWTDEQWDALRPKKK